MENKVSADRSSFPGFSLWGKQSLHPQMSLPRAWSRQSLDRVRRHPHSEGRWPQPPQGRADDGRYWGSNGVPAWLGYTHHSTQEAMKNKNKNKTKCTYIHTHPNQAVTAPRDKQAQHLQGWHPVLSIHATLLGSPCGRPWAAAGCQLDTPQHAAVAHANIQTLPLGASHCPENFADAPQQPPRSNRSPFLFFR